jgi:rubrerythrin
MPALTVVSKGRVIMPEFATPFSGNSLGRKLTRDELIRALRYSISAEYEAIQLYTQLAEASDDELAAAVLRDVADEERTHAGEFMKVLKRLDPEEERLYAEGEAEVEEILSRLRGA